MKIKPEWTVQLQKLRKQEIDIIFKSCPKHCFSHGLELGAGDGFQSTLLSHFCHSLICTEYDKKKLTKVGSKHVSYKICDAEQLPIHFDRNSFDLIFSSNLIEHLHRRKKVLKDVYNILKDGGMVISVMPGPFIKLCWLIFFYPNQIISLIEVISNKGIKFLLHLVMGSSKEIDSLRGDLGNNPTKKTSNWLLSQLYPKPHGSYNSHLEELFAYQPKQWTKLLKNTGFQVISIRKMPVTSGYGFGLTWLKNILEKIGLAYGYAFIAKKNGYGSPYECFFNND